jgi:S-adenosylmethionine:tRNA ribosyltransferase-isomerase
VPDPRQTAAYDYELPPELIAQEPAPQRDASRLMVLHDATIEHRTFREFPEQLERGDVLVINETQVVKARLFGELTSGGRAEVLLLRPAGEGAFDYAARRWEVLARPGRRLRAGARVRFGDVTAAIVGVEADGRRIVEFEATVDVAALVDRSGLPPLPPYIRQPPADALERYQTIFARVPGSVAAPTASLHFTAAVMERIRARGVTVVPIVLDVGIGTFRPITSARLDEHTMHAERYEIPASSAAQIRQAKAQQRRVIAAGTTVVRALEGAAQTGTVREGSGATALFIMPGYEFRVVDALLTNFHLPRSTLLALVSAFAGYGRIMTAYAEAVRSRYRFFSFGDAMFIAGRG